MIDIPGFRGVAPQGLAASRTSPLPTRVAGSGAGARPVADVSRTTEMLAAVPPVDTERVAAIRNAIASGSYPIQPAKIADALIAARWLLIDGGPA